MSNAIRHNPERVYSSTPLFLNVENQTPSYYENEIIVPYFDTTMPKAYRDYFQHYGERFMIHEPWNDLVEILRNLPSEDYRFQLMNSLLALNTYNPLTSAIPLGNLKPHVAKKVQQVQQYIQKHWGRSYQYKTKDITALSVYAQEECMTYLAIYLMHYQILVLNLYAETTIYIPDVALRANVYRTLLQKEPQWVEDSKKGVLKTLRKSKIDFNSPQIYQELLSGGR